MLSHPSLMSSHLFKLDWVLMSIVILCMIAAALYGMLNLIEKLYLKEQHLVWIKKGEIGHPVSPVWIPLILLSFTSVFSLQSYSHPDHKSASFSAPWISHELMDILNQNCLDLSISLTTIKIFFNLIHSPLISPCIFYYLIII